MTIQERLLLEFRRTGMTYAQFAVRAGISESLVHKKLNGTRRMHIGDVERIARALGFKLKLERKPRRRR